MQSRRMDTSMDWFQVALTIQSYVRPTALRNVRISPLQLVRTYRTYYNMDPAHSKSGKWNITKVSHTVWAGDTVPRGPNHTFTASPSSF